MGRRFGQRLLPPSYRPSPSDGRTDLHRPAGQTFTDPPDKPARNFGPRTSPAPACEIGASSFQSVRNRGQLVSVGCEIGASSFQSVRNRGQLVSVGCEIGASPRADFPAEDFHLGGYAPPRVKILRRKIRPRGRLCSPLSADLQGRWPLPPSRFTLQCNASLANNALRNALA